jgi:chromosome segregation ATPase
MTIPYKKQFVKSDGRKLTRSGPRDMQARGSEGGGTDPALIDLLTNQITDLKAEMRSIRSRSGDAAPAGFFSAEQVDEEIRRAVESAVAETAVSLKAGMNQKDSDLLPLIKEYKSQILELQKGNDNLTRLHATITKENSEIKARLQKLNAEMGDVNELKQSIAVLEQELAGKEETIEILKSRPAITNDGPIEHIDPDRPQMEQVFVDPLEEDASDGMESNITIETIVKDEEVDGKVDKLRDLLGSLPKR